MFLSAGQVGPTGPNAGAERRINVEPELGTPHRLGDLNFRNVPLETYLMRVGQGAALPMGNVGNTQVFNRITAIENNLNPNPFAQNGAFVRPPGAMNSNSVGSIQDNEELLLAWRQQDSHQLTYLDTQTAVSITPYFPAGDIHYPHIAEAIGGDRKQVDLDVPLIQFWGLPEELQDELLHFQRVQWENYKAQEPGAFDPLALRGRVHDQAKKITQETFQKVETISFRPKLELLQQLLNEQQQKRVAAYIEVIRQPNFNQLQAANMLHLFGEGAPLPPPSPERLPPDEKEKRKKLELPPFQLTDMREQAGNLKLELPELRQGDDFTDPDLKNRTTIGDAAEDRALIGDPEMDEPKKKAAAGTIDHEMELKKLAEEEEDDDDDKGLGSARKKALAAMTLPKALQLLQENIFKPENEKAGKVPTQAQTNRAVTRAIEIFYTKNARGDYVIEPPTTWLQINFYAYIQHHAVELGLVGRKGVEAGVVVEPTPQVNPAVQAWLAKRAERGERSLPQIDLEAAKRNRSTPIQTLIGRAAGPASAVRLLTMEDFRAALGNSIFSEFQGYFADQSNNTLFDFTLHYFRLFFHRNPEMFGNPELLATAEIDQGIIADIFTHVEHASERFDENIVREFSELFQLTVNEVAAAAQHAEILAGTTTPRASATAATRNYLPYPHDAATQALGLGGFLNQLPGFTEREVRELFQAEVGVSQSTAFNWGSVRALRVDGLPDRDFEAIRAMREARGEVVPAEKAHVDATMWNEYTDYLREQGHLEYVTAHPSNDSLGIVFNVYTFAREYAQAQGLDIDFFDFLCALSPPFRRLRERSRSEDGHQTVYIAVPNFMRELPFANWGYSTWAQLFEQRSIASHVLPATVHQHATGGTEFPEYQTLGHYTARINDEHESAYNFAASLMRWAFLFDSGLEVLDVSGTPVTQTSADETPSNFRIQLVDDPSEIPEGGEAIVSGSRLAIRHDAQRGVYRNRLEFVGDYLAAVAFLPVALSLQDRHGQVVELETLRDQLERLREQERIFSTVLSDRNPELAATRSHQNLENIFQFYRELHHFIDQTLFFTAVRGEVPTAHGPIPFRASADVSNIQRDAFTWTGDTVVVVDDIPAAVAREHWAAQDISDLLQCRTLVAFLRGINEFPQANGIPSEAEVISALQSYWHGTSTALTLAANRYVQLERARLERARVFDESSTAPKPTGGRRSQHIFGPVLPARRFAGTWQEQFVEFAIATAGLSPELSATGQIVLEEYFRTVPASVTHFWPVALERIIATHVPVVAERAPLYRAIVDFLPTVGVANEVVSRQLDPSRKLEDQIGEWAKTDYIALFPVREGLEGSKVPVENSLIDDLIDHTMEQHAAGRALRRRDIRAYVVRELGLYNQGRPEPSRELGAADLLLADHGRATERLNNFCARWEAEHEGTLLDRTAIRRGYQSLSERVLLGETISAAQIAQALGSTNNSQNVEVLQSFVAQQAHDLRTLQTYIGTQGAGIDAYVRQQFRNTDYVNADGLIALATHHARRVLATDGDIDIAAIALDAVDPSFEPYRSIAERMAVSYQALYRHFAHNLARHFSSQVELVQAAIATVRDDIQEHRIEIPATREAFTALVFEHSNMSDQQELTELNQHANLMQSIVGGAATTDLQREINLAYDEITNFNERNLVRIAEIQAEAEPLLAGVSDFAERVATITDGYLALTAVRDDADENIARAAIAEAVSGLNEIQVLQTELAAQRENHDQAAVFLLEMNELGSTALDAESYEAETQLRTAEAQLTSASTHLTTLREAAEFRLVVLEDDANNAEKIAKTREAAAQIQQDFAAVESAVEDELGIAEEYLRLLPQNHRKIMAALQRRVLQHNIPLEEFDSLMDRVVDFGRDATIFADDQLPKLDQRLAELQSLNARIEQTLQDLPEQDRAAFGATYFAAHSLFIRLTELISSHVHSEDMVNTQYKTLLQLEQNIEITTSTVVALAGQLPALVESDVRVSREGQQEITNRFRETEASGSFSEARRALQDFLDAEVSNEGSPSVLISRQTAEKIRAWKNTGSVGDLSIHDIFGQKRDLPAYMMPLAVLTRQQLPENHPYTRLLTAVHHLLEHSSNEARLVAELRKHPNFFNQIARLFAYEPPITSNEQARLLVRRYAISHIAPILDALSEGDVAKRQRMLDRYFIIEKKPLPSATPAPASTAAVATPTVRTAEQIRATLPTDLADLAFPSLEDLLSGNHKKFRVQVYTLAQQLGLDTSQLDQEVNEQRKLQEKSDQGGKGNFHYKNGGGKNFHKWSDVHLSLRLLQMLYEAKAFRDEKIDSKLESIRQAISTGLLAYSMNHTRAKSDATDAYNEMQKIQQKLYDAVAAHRAANPDPNDPHPEILPWSDYAGIESLSPAQIAAKILQMSVLPTTIDERLALAAELGLQNEVTRDMLENPVPLPLVLLIAKQAGFYEAVPSDYARIKDMQDRGNLEGIGRIYRENSRLVYHLLFQHRSRIIAEVVRREEAAKAVLKAAAASASSVQGAPALNFPTDLADLLPASARTDAEIEAAIDALNLFADRTSFEDTKARRKARLYDEFKLVEQRELSLVGRNPQQVKETTAATKRTVEGLSDLAWKMVIIGGDLKIDTIEITRSKSQMYKALLAVRDKVLTLVAAHRAANPGNDPHPELLPLSDYAGVEQMTENEVVDRIQQTGLIPATKSERIALAKKLGLTIADNALADVNISSSTLFLILISLLKLEALQKAIGPYVPRLMQAQAASDPQQLRSINILMTRASYRALLENRSRVIAEVVRREEAAKATEARKAIIASGRAAIVDTTQAAPTSVPPTLAMQHISNIASLEHMDHTAFRTAVMEIGSRLNIPRDVLMRAQTEWQAHLGDVDQYFRTTPYYQNTGRALFVTWGEVLASLSMLGVLLHQTNIIGESAKILERNNLVNYIARRINSASTPLHPATAEKLAKAYYDFLLEHRDKLLQLLEEKRAAFLAPQATPVGDQSLNSGLTFMGANPETTVSPVPAPPSRK